ncbi:MAG: antitoxin family protein [Rhodothermales bacterium]
MGAKDTLPFLPKPTTLCALARFHGTYKNRANIDGDPPNLTFQAFVHNKATNEPVKPMKTQKVDAIFEDGSFKPLMPLDPVPKEGQHVRIVIEPLDGAEQLLDLTTQVYEGLSDEEIDEIEEIALDRSTFFVDRAED